jgi:RNA polymerase primary sigma factor
MSFRDNDSFLQKLGQHDLLTRQEERRLLRRAQKGHLASEGKLLRMNCRLIMKLASEFSDRGLPFADLFQAGSIGYLKAIRRYDLKRSDKPRLSTLAVWWVRAEIQREIQKSSRNIRLPPKLISALHQHRRSGGGVPPPDDPLHRAIITETVSLDQPIRGHEESDLLEFLRSEAPDADSAVTAEENKTVIDDGLSELRPIEAAIIRARLLNDLTLKQTADVLHYEKLTRRLVTRERVRQIETKALKKFKNILIRCRRTADRR